MNSKQRVLAAIDHVEPDHVPADMWALPPVTDSLRAHFGVDDDEGVWRALGIDLRSVWPSYVGPPLETFDDGSWMDWWGLHRKMIGPFEEVIAPPLADAQTVADVEAHAWPDPDWFDYEGMRPICQELGDYALVIRDPGQNATCVLRVAMFLRGMDHFMLDLALNTDLARAVIERVERFYLEFDRRIFETAGDLTDIYFIADDVGMQQGLLISPQTFRDFIKPSLSRLMAQGKSYGQKVMYHTCGAVRDLVPDFIEMGVDILNPIQVSAKGMEPPGLKRDFGGDLCFHGALDIQTVLSQGTPDQVRAEVERLCDVLGPGGGYILAPTNNVMPETPVENIVALYETARAAGRYH
ncbi:MAG: uroporphyrinogen decarboxylase family protein [Anaerolineae bacterium]